MSGTRKILIGLVGIIVIGSAAIISVRQGGDKGVEVRVEEVTRRDLVATVTASGNIRPRRMVDISADVMGRIVDLTVDEGAVVELGEVLLRIDPTQYQAALSRARAGLSQARANAAQQEANSIQAVRELDRLRTIVARDSALVSRQQVEDAATRVEVQRALYEAANFGVEQAQAAVAESEDQLEKTIIRAPISGRVTRLSVEEGEMAVIGTMNNPGSLLLTVSDLSVMEAVMQVDETDVPEITLGDSAVVELDAFPGKTYTGRVTEIGNSAIVPPSQTAGTGQTAAIDFEVVITLEDPPDQIRPDLSSTADIVTDVRENVLTIPIIALTIREEDRASATASDEEDRGNRPETAAGPAARESEPVEGVFRVRDGVVEFVPVETGIAGREHFEILSGIDEGDVVVSGPYQRIRALTSGDPIKIIEEAEGETSESPSPAGN